MSYYSSATTTARAGHHRCRWTGCPKTYGRSQELHRHILSTHLPYPYFCPTQFCSWRGGRVDEFRAHSEACNPGHQSKPGMIYNTQLVLGLIDDGTAVDIVKSQTRYFVAERARELGKTEAWEDLCGRRYRTGQCDCDG
ncbi:hypothetical protein BGW80DRAFT_598358 [Lactifluus volemus]|nr:hypothetical protein BGW80DRAFT_598358 [Lactifluus volemus]